MFERQKSNITPRFEAPIHRFVSTPLTGSFCFVPSPAFRSVYSSFRFERCAAKELSCLDLPLEFAARNRRQFHGKSRKTRRQTSVASLSFRLTKNRLLSALFLSESKFNFYFPRSNATTFVFASNSLFQLNHYCFFFTLNSKRLNLQII